MSIFNSLLWRAVTPGCYERGIDEAEQFYTSMAKTWEATGHTYFAITACTGISISKSPVSGGSSLDARVEAAFRWGWKKMRYDHPTLAAPTQYDHHSKRCKKTGEDFANTDPPAGRWDIVFRCHHDLVDGIGTLMLLNNLLHHAAEAFESSTEQGIAFGDEHKNLSPPLRIAAGIPIAPSVDQLANLARIQSTNKAARIGKCVLGVPFSPDAEAPGSSQRSAIHFSPQESSSVVAKSKSFQSTMTQILHTAIALAIRDLQPKTSEAYEARYFSYSLVNLRHCCVPPYHKPRHAASVYHCVSANHLVVDLTVPAESIATHDQSLEEFQSTLGQVRDFYNNAKIDADYLSIVPSLFSIVTPKYPSTTSDIPAPNQSPSVSLSSVGIVDRIVQPKQGPFEILEPWVVGAEYSTGIGAFLGTWNGALCLSAGYNEAFHSKAKVLDFLESVKRIVLDGLELDHSHVETELPVRATS
ncbi:uncharacterized protein RSE6_08507 [Rhynchosporium secalis]|uniref:Uncharacterized protein n=1 Tax=Rhynchosporium secalis TaxID=38038 RepID=A0A1E1MFP7_RHYSE|nr:uncharacterized protein RSE6_08507 [Rhynchosporium secalis]